MAKNDNKKNPPSYFEPPRGKSNGNGKKRLVKMEFAFKLDPKKSLLWFLILLLFVPFLFSLFSVGSANRIPLSQLLSDIKGDKVDRVEIDGATLTAKYNDGSVKTSRKEASQDLTTVLRQAEIDITSLELLVRDQPAGRLLGEVLINVLPMLLMVVFFLFLFRQARGAQGDIMGFGKSKAKLFAKGKQDVKFADVGGLKEAKRELEEIVDFLRNPKKYQQVGARTPKGALLIGPAGTGKCVTGDTIVWTNKGLMEIREIPRYYYVDPKSHQVYGAGVSSFDVDQTVSKDVFASHWYDLGEQETVKIRLSQGFEIEGTPEHPVVVITADGQLKFRKLSDIQKGDHVAVQYGRQAFGTVALVDSDTAYVMGVLVGNGSMNHSSRIGLTSIDDEIVTVLESYVTQRYPNNAITRSSNGQFYLEAKGDFKQYLDYLGMSYVLAFDKVVPPTILQAPKEIQVSFLRGLFDTGAFVGKTRAELAYSTGSKKMARQVQMMLLNLGVVAALQVKNESNDGHYQPVYRITMSGESGVAFAKHVGFGLKRKQQLLSQTHKMTRVTTTIDIIPGISRLIEESCKELSVRKLSKKSLSKTVDKIRRGFRVSRQMLREYVAYATTVATDIAHIEYLRSLLEANLFFSPVVEKAYSMQRVYDFTVPQTHSFLSNGMISHNTLLARAVAGEANVPFFSMAGSEFMEMLVGVGASRVRDLFDTAKKAAPSIIFIDEIDAIGRMRGHGSMGGHDEREQTLNQILVEMDGFLPNDTVIVLAATNRADLLDPALVRPGRFDRRVTLDLPDLEERKYILSIHSKNKPFADDVNWDRVAKRTVGFSGADLENLLNEAAIAVARENREKITPQDIEEAALKVKLGPEKKKLQSELERKMTAYHEAGHAIVAHFLPHTDPVHRISIVSRGRALGFTMTPPEQDKYQQTKIELEEQISVMLGGRAAEKLIFNQLTGGVSSDLERVTRIARAMVMDYGMSDLAPINYGPMYEFSDYGRAMMDPYTPSEEVKKKVDAAVDAIVEDGWQRALKLLKTHRKALDAVAERLLEVESMDEDDFVKVVGTPKVKAE